MSTPIYDEVSNSTDVTTNENGEPTLTPNNKVQKGIIAGALVTVAVAVLSAVTPDMLTFAGQFTPLVFAAIGSVIALGTAYLAKPVG